VDDVDIGVKPLPPFGDDDDSNGNGVPVGDMAAATAGNIFGSVTPLAALLSIFIIQYSYPMVITTND
jgi:hypothetical protein